MELMGGYRMFDFHDAYQRYASTPWWAWAVLAGLFLAFASICLSRLPRAPKKPHISRTVRRHHHRTWGQTQNVFPNKVPPAD
ncbi:MAG: hypothetical protein P4M11_05135 [Candidatus Pacebacteria bacterium]|nr:hypothetical protein [Candidatus Paceibacterota bacterium]